MYYIYVLYSSKLRKRYIGVTGKNPYERLREHQRGQVPFTRRAKDWRLVYKKVFDLKTEAYAEERFFKSGKGREKLKNLLEGAI